VVGEEKEVRRDDVLSSRAMAVRVKRYHTWRTIQTQTVGEHCCRVAQIYCELWGLPRAEVLYYALHHDSGELLSGDVPFLAKSESAQLKEGCRAVEKKGLERLRVELPLLTMDEQRRMKIADLMEMYEFGHVDWTMGNAYAEPIERDTMSEAILVATVEEIEVIREWARQGKFRD
jgi:5'-deoxynucleotidase YfbR-like HD superfamily hydrolase